MVDTLLGAFYILCKRTQRLQTQLQKAREENERIPELEKEIEKLNYEVSLYGTRGLRRQVEGLTTQLKRQNEVTIPSYYKRRLEIEKKETEFQWQRRQISKKDKEIHRLKKRIAELERQIGESQTEETKE